MLFLPIIGSVMIFKSLFILLDAQKKEMSKLPSKLSRLMITSHFILSHCTKMLLA